jgi:hypothetical protein
MAELVRRYADRRLGGTDAWVIAVCERLSVATVATVNRRDFANVRPGMSLPSRLCLEPSIPAGTAGGGIGRSASPRKRRDQAADGACPPPGAADGVICVTFCLGLADNNGRQRTPAVFYGRSWTLRAWRRPVCVRGLLAAQWDAEP